MQSELKFDIRDGLKRLYSYKGVERIEGHFMPGHIQGALRRCLVTRGFSQRPKPPVTWMTATYQQVIFSQKLLFKIRVLGGSYERWINIYWKDGKNQSSLCTDTASVR